MIHNPKYCLFFDNHTMAACPDVGAEFNADRFVDQVTDCGADFLTFHARCNQGLAYYDTKIGTRHPSLKYDLFGQLAETCARRGVTLSAYFNVGISHEEAIQHREWLRLNFDGREYREPRSDAFVRTMCYNTPYRDHLIAMVLEVARNYPVAGFFLDCMGPYPCICPICVREMKEQNLDWSNLEMVSGFARFSAKRLAQDIARALATVRPDYLLYFNGVSYEDQLDFATYLECECLPTGGWGYDYLPVRAHYMRTLTDLPIVNMTGRFYNWGDFGGLRTEESIKFELLYGLAHGMRPNIGDHFHPRGDMPTPVSAQNRRIYESLQKLEPWIDGAANLTEVGVIHQGEPDTINASQPLKGAVRMLGELKIQFDIITEYKEWKKYRVLLLPDEIVITDSLKSRLQTHIQGGGAIISSGTSGLDPSGLAFALPDDWGIEFVGPCLWHPTYFTMSESLPAMPISLYSQGILCNTTPTTKILANLVKPYYNEGWDGEHSFTYNPPDRCSGFPALTYSYQVAHFSHKIFGAYYAKASVDLRHLFSSILQRVMPGPLLETSGLPSFARAFVTRQSGRWIIHILSYVPERRGENIEIIEDKVAVLDGMLSLRIDGADIERVYLAPDRVALPFEQTSDRAWVNLPPFAGYAMIVFEEK